MFKISKEFGFCYGHRVWTQILSGDQVCKCKRIHGHNGVLKIELESGELDNDMVLDYVELDVIKKFVDSYLDHRTILDFNDPMLPFIVKDWQIYKTEFGFNLITPINVPGSQVELDLYDSIVLMRGCPTSENVCKLLFDEMVKELPQLKSISFKETDKTEAVYTRPLWPNVVGYDPAVKDMKLVLGEING